MNKGAEISACSRYRFSLTRSWDPDKGAVVFIGLNPSTADANNDDPTIRRCVGFVKDWGYGHLVMVNLSPFRATAPGDMLQHTPTPEAAYYNLSSVTWAARHAKVVVAAWGAHGAHQGMDKAVMEALRGADVRVMCLGRTKKGMPKHPLYLKKNQKLEEYVES